MISSAVVKPPFRFMAFANRQVREKWPRIIKFSTEGEWGKTGDVVYEILTDDMIEVAFPTLTWLDPEEVWVPWEVQ